MKKNKRRSVMMLLSSILVFSLAAAWLLQAATQVQAQANLMNDITPQVDAAQTPDLMHDAIFTDCAADFSVSLFRQCFSGQKNTLLSPLSVMLALGMTANGADGGTKAEMEALLGGGKLNTSQLNRCYSALCKRLQDVKDGKLSIINSIWYDDALNVERSFLQTNADYFGANAFLLDFADAGSVSSINNWTKENTNGMINKMVESIAPDTVMYLINALLFEADWQKPYEAEDSSDGVFYAAGKDATVKFMTSYETYFQDEAAQGILKNYKDSRYAFAAILPNEEIPLKQYVNSMTGENFRSLLKSTRQEKAVSRLPKFKYEYETRLVQPLKAMGLKKAFDAVNANFSKMGTCENGNVYIGDVIHKTYIEVDELGTRAGAATAVEMKAGSAALEPLKTIVFNRPFVYAIVEKQTGIPVFIGTVVNPQK